ncbi:MAG: hypothetical protein GF400_07340 [Candidatus Eisenbacteria bacterium]|nr:hypothetical protein [Candidatus Eisenbacteria bacterium]
MVPVRFRFVVLLLTVAVVSSGCGNSNPGGSEDESPDGLWVRGYYANFVDESRVAVASCSVDVRMGDSDGEAVSDLTVSCNGEELFYSQGVYTSDLTDVAPGGDVVFVISNARDEYTGVVVVPDPPTGLQLAEGSWDFDDPSGSHTLTWDCAATVADSIMVFLVGTGPHSWNVVAYTKYVPCAATELTIQNSNLPDGFSVSTELEAGVLQVDTGALDMGTGDSRIWARCGPFAWWDL